MFTFFLCRAICLRNWVGGDVGGAGVGSGVERSAFRGAGKRCGVLPTSQKLVRYEAKESEKRWTPLSIDGGRRRSRAESCDCTAWRERYQSSVGTLRSHELRYVVETSAGTQRALIFDANAERHTVENLSVLFDGAAPAAPAFSARIANR